MIKIYQMAIILNIEADDYEIAYEDVENIMRVIRASRGADGLNTHCYSPTYDFDNDGQRVVYLHAEDNPILRKGKKS